MGSTTLVRSLVSAGLLAQAAAAQTTTLYTAHPEDGGGFGTVVASVPDTNGDGIADIVVGAFNQQVGTVLGAGRVTIHSGANGAILKVLVSPNKETLGWFGGAVAGVPDITGDGRGEVLVGAYNEINTGSPESGIGRAYLFNGATGQYIRTITSPNAEVGGAFGRAVAGLGDVTGDGKGDLVISGYREDPNAAPTDAGRVYIFNGATGALYKTLVAPGQSTGGLFGVAVAAMPDATGDGKPDIVIGASGENPAGLDGAGRVYIFNGVTGVYHKILISPNKEAGGRFGSAVSGVADTNGDSLGDVIIGASFETQSGIDNAGRAYLFSGGAGTLLRTYYAGAPEAGDLFGSAVAGVPDCNGDSRGDVAIGAAHADPGGAPSDAGRAYIFSGANGAFLRSMNSPAQEAGAAFGNSIAGIADVNNNGKGDVIVGCPFENTPTIDDVGRAYLFRN